MNGRIAPGSSRHRSAPELRTRRDPGDTPGPRPITAGRGQPMHLFRRASRAARLALLAAALATGFAVPPAALAAEEPEPSDIVIVLDFSSSILDDEDTRTAFADALDRLAARTEEIGDTLLQGDVTVSIV